MKKRILYIIMILMVAIFSVGCESRETEMKKDDSLNVVTTIFASYDFARQIIGDDNNITLLLPAGTESHSYEPTPQDIIKIQNCDVFVYIGGESDSWVSSILDSIDTSNIRIVKMMDCVDLLEEEFVEGMQDVHNELDEDNHNEEMDEHVWASPKNAILIVNTLSNIFCELDNKNAELYKTNTEKYIEDLNNLDGEFRDIINNAKRKEIIVADRFPFRYFVEEYGITYYSAFSGCSSDTEANASTIAFLIDKVKEDNIPIVFKIELTNEQMCNSICEATGAKSEILHAVHNISKEDFKNGVTYIDLMKHNAIVLKEALN